MQKAPVPDSWQPRDVVVAWATDTSFGAAASDGAVQTGMTMCRNGHFVLMFDLASRVADRVVC